MLNVSELEQSILSGDAEKIASLVQTYNLKIKDNKIIAEKEVKDKFVTFWDQRQLIKKILLNS